MTQPPVDDGGSFDPFMSGSNQNNDDFMMLGGEQGDQPTNIPGLDDLDVSWITLSKKNHKLPFFSRRLE